MEVVFHLTGLCVIRDSQQGFELLRLNSLLPWAFLQQDKKTRIN